MFDIVCVTNRTLCKEDFLKRIEKIASAHPSAIILREKDLSEDEYKVLAAHVTDICAKHNVKCVLHTFIETAKELKHDSIHLPMHLLSNASKSDLEQIETLGASCHSPQEAVEAENLGCTYITAGHVFDTACKKGLPGRGVDFLKRVCESVSIPVYAIGGINSDKVKEVKKAGADGVCIMSQAMTCENPKKLFDELKNAVEE